MDEFQSAFCLIEEIEMTNDDAVAEASARTRYGMTIGQARTLLATLDAFSNKRMAQDEYHSLCAEAFERDFTVVVLRKVTSR